MSEFNFKKYLKEGKLLKESENDEGNYQLTDTKDEPINIGDIVWRFRLGNEPDDFAYYKGDTKEEAISKIPSSVKNDPYVRRKMQGGSLVGGFGKSFEIKSGSDLEDLKYDMERGFLDDVYDSVDEGRHYYGAGMDDEDEEPRSSRSRYGGGNSSAYERGTAIPKRYTYQDEEEEEEEIEFVKGKDYEAQNQRVLRNMDESKFDKALKSASTKLAEGKKKKKIKKIEKEKKEIKLNPDMFSGVVEDAMIDMNFYSISDISSDKSKSKKFLKLALKGMKQQDSEKIKKLSEKEQLDFFITSARNI